MEIGTLPFSLILSEVVTSATLLVCNKVSLAQADLELGYVAKNELQLLTFLFHFPRTETTSNHYQAQVFHLLSGWPCVHSSLYGKKGTSEHTSLCVLWPLSEKGLKCVRVNFPMKQNTISQL